MRSSSTQPSLRAKLKVVKGGGVEHAMVFVRIESSGVWVSLDVVCFFRGTCTEDSCVLHLEGSRVVRML